MQGQGSVGKFLSKLNAILLEYNKPNGCVPDHLKLKNKIGVISLTFISMMAAFSSLKKIQLGSSDLVKKKKYLGYHKILLFTMAGAMAAVGYINYQIVQSIPESTLEENQKQSYEKFSKYLKQVQRNKEVVEIKGGKRVE